MAWQNPKTDWNTNPKSPMAADFNRIEGNIQYVLDQIEAKKGIIVNAINEKEEVVTIENSYQELADAIGVINLNPRVASGTAIFSKVPPIVNVENLGEVAQSLKFEVVDLPFTPSKVNIRGAFSARIKNNELPASPWYTPQMVTFKYGIVNNILVEDRRYGTYLVMIAGGQYGSWNETYSKVSTNITFQDKGFTVMITALEPSSYPHLREISGSGGIQYWFAQE